MSICVPRWYWEEMQTYALPTTHERNTMDRPKSVSKEDFDQAMCLLGLLVDPDIAIMSVHIEQGMVMAEYAQRVKVVYSVGWSGCGPEPADATVIRTSRDGKVPSDGQATS